jgi:hypothetical protein
MNRKELYSPNLTTCPRCADEDALVRLVKVKGRMFCPFHGELETPKEPRP